MSTQPEFDRLLQQTMGLDPASVGHGAIERAVLERQAACRMPDAQAYWQHVLTSPGELQELVETVVVPETWFFRDREAFAALARMVMESWLPSHPLTALRVLSLPCSSGEEPYSIAMALLDAGLPAERFSVDAIDISARALAQAGRARYGRNSFRGDALDFRERHFEADGRSWQLREPVRRQVRFAQGNLLAPDFLPGAELYDVIFCRNVLIYFDRATQDRAIGVLGRVLTTDGMLFVAPSETGLLLSHGFASTRVPLAFAFTRSAPAVAAPSPVLPPARPRPVPAARAPRAATPVKTKAPEPTVDLGEATRLADQGQLAQAARLCEDYLRRHGPAAEAFYLLGLVYDTQAQPSLAALHYRKALYLDPHHAQALVHLALLQEQQGNSTGARLLRNRGQRAAGKQAER